MADEIRVLRLLGPKKLRKRKEENVGGYCMSFT
jgi:hypothetical protein